MNLKSYLRGIGVGILVTAAVFLISGRNDKNASMTDAQIIARAKQLGLVEATTVADAGKHKEEAASNESNADKSESKAVDNKTESKNDAVEKTDATKEDKSTEKTDAGKEDKSSEKADVTKEDKSSEKADATKENKSTEKADATKDDKSTEKADVTKEDKTSGKTDETKTEVKKDTADNKKEQTASADEIIIVVNPGDGSDTVAKKFFDAGLVDNAHEFDLFLMEKGYDRKITVGNHKIKKNATKDEMGINLITSTK